MIKNLSTNQKEWLEKKLKLINKNPIEIFSKLRLESSQRDFYRIFFSDKKTVILMIIPEGADESVSLFTKKAEIFKENAVNVPVIFFENEKLGLIIVEDFGDEIYQFKLSDEKADLFYDLAIEELVKIQSIDLDKKVFDVFDNKKLLENWSLFEEFFLKLFLEDKVNDSSKKALKECYKKVCINLVNQPQVICHYDFECRNLIYMENKTGILDFQDALIGPIGLDPASLFKDLYFFWPKEKTAFWYKKYQKRVRKKLNLEIPTSKLVEYIDYCSIQRQFRILGKLSQVFIELNRTNRIKDFPTLFNYLINTSKIYNKLSPISEILIPLKKILNERLANIS